mmetsp:Transcript_18979/g.44613  ORF Transcript_18979/g.44613 Transcript_18979/m.44613 type:complete len:286 (+) Transcript_18979:542-1399(+)
MPRCKRTTGAKDTRICLAALLRPTWWRSEHGGLGGVELHSLQRRAQCLGWLTQCRCPVKDARRKEFGEPRLHAHMGAKLGRNLVGRLEATVEGRTVDDGCPRGRRNDPNCCACPLGHLTAIFGQRWIVGPTAIRAPGSVCALPVAQDEEFCLRCRGLRSPLLLMRSFSFHTVGALGQCLRRWSQLDARVDSGRVGKAFHDEFFVIVSGDMMHGIIGLLPRSFRWAHSPAERVDDLVSVLRRQGIMILARFGALLAHLRACGHPHCFKVELDALHETLVYCTGCVL